MDKLQMFQSFTPPFVSSTKVSIGKSAFPSSSYQLKRVESASVFSMRSKNTSFCAVGSTLRYCENNCVFPQEANQDRGGILKTIKGVFPMEILYKEKGSISYGTNNNNNFISK